MGRRWNVPSLQSSDQMCDHIRGEKWIFRSCSSRNRIIRNYCFRIYPSFCYLGKKKTETLVHCGRYQKGDHFFREHPVTSNDEIPTLTRKHRKKLGRISAFLMLPMFELFLMTIY